jgi:hypothetical protein
MPSRVARLTGLVIATVLLACSDSGPDAKTTEDASAAEAEGGTAVVDGGKVPAATADAGRDAGPSRVAAGSDAGPSGDASADARTPSSATGDAATPSGPDAGARAYSTDRSQFFGDSRCDRDTFLLCEDFESEAPGSPADPSVWQTPDDRLRVDATRAARGAHALSVVTRSNEGTHFIRSSKIAPAAKKKLWGRLFFWVQSPRPGSFSHWTAIEATGVHPAGGTARTRVGGIHIPGVENRLDFNYDIWGGRPAGFHEVGFEVVGQDLPDATWHCLEWMFDVGAREARIFRDGKEETKLAASKSIDGIALDFPEIDGINIGMAIYQDIKADTWKVWIDEVAIDLQRIGCSN